jgi:hypothetical protein
MSNHLLIGFVNPQTAARLEANPDFTIMGTKAKCVQFLDIVAVLTEPVRVGLLATTRKRLTAELGHFQEWLEVLVPSGPVVAATYGTKFDNVTDVLAFMSGNLSYLREAMTNFGRLRQMQIDIEWDEKVALAHFRQDPRMVAAVARGSGGNPIKLGQEIQGAMEEIRAELAAKAREKLIAASIECIEMPIAATGFVAAAVALIDPENEPVLLAAVEAIDALVPDLFTIRYKGPLPACSFASVGVQVIEKKDIAAARTLLGVEQNVSAADINDAFRAMMMQNHPDRGGNGDMIATAKSARDLLINVNEVERSILPSTRTRADRNFLFSLHRDGDTRKAA